MSPTSIPNPLRSSQWSWGDGAFVDENAQKCTVRTGTDRNRLRAKVGLGGGGKKGEVFAKEDLSVNIWLSFFLLQTTVTFNFFVHESGVSKWWLYIIKFPNLMRD